MNLTDIKIVSTIKQYLHRARKDNRALEAENIKRLKRINEGRDPFVPVSGNYRLFPLELLDLQKLNAEIDMVSIDFDTISTMNQNLIEDIRNRFLLNEIVKRIYTNKAKKVKTDTVFLTSNQFINGFTREVDLKKDINLNQSDAENGATGIRIRTENETTGNATSYPEDAVTVVVSRYSGTPEDPGLAPEIRGRKASIIDGTFDNGIDVIVSSYLTESISTTIRANVNVRNVNHLDIFMDEPEKAQYVNIEINTSGNNKKSIFSGVVKTSKISVSFSPTDIKFVFVTFTQKLANYTLGGVQGYKFNIQKIKFTNTTRKKGARAVTNSLPISSDTRLLSLVAEEYIPDGTNITYKLSYDKNDSGDHINFFEVLPTSRVNANIEQNFIRIGTRRFIQSIEHNTMVSDAIDWRFIEPEKKYGGKLYCIIDISSLIDIENNTIVEDTMKVFRGIGDWSIERNKNRVTSIYKRIPLFPVFDTSTKSYGDLPIVVTYEEEILPHDTGSFLVKYKPQKEADYQIYDQNLKQIKMNITNFDAGTVGAKYKIVVDQTLVPGTRYNIKYHIKLEDIIDKDTKVLSADTILSTPNRILTEGTDFYILNETNAKTIRFLKSGNYRGEELFADYAVQEETKKDIKVYKTVLTADKNTIIAIVPFNKTEIEAGNFHRLNGDDISKKNTIAINAGTYVIESTQIYPGINQFTNINSNASVTIPAGEVEQKAYEETLRKVSIYDLVINSEVGDHRQFAYTNGKIYLNRVPDFVTSYDISAEGKYVKCIKLDDELSPIPIPEKFRLEFDYSALDRPKELALEISLTNSDSGTPASPEIRRLGINEFNTDINI